MTKAVATLVSPLRLVLFIPVSVGLLLSGFVLGPFILMGNAPGDLGDARFNTFVLEHVYRFVTGRAADFASPGIFYPFPETLFFSETYVGSVLVYIIFRTTGFAELQAFTGWFFIGYVTTYVAAHYAFVKIGLKLWPAIVAAMVFAFALPSLAQISHAQLVYRGGVPLAMVYLWRNLRMGSAADFIAALAWLLVQTLFSIYLGVFLGLLMASFAAAYLFFEGRSLRAEWIDRLRRDLKRRAVSPGMGDIGLGLVFVVLSVVTAALLLGYAHVTRIYWMHRPIDEVTIGLPRASSYFLMDSLPYWHHLLPSIGNLPLRHEHQMFVGLGVLGLFSAGIWQFMFGQTSVKARSLNQAMLAALVILVVFTLNIGGSFALYSKISLYRLLAEVPGFNAIRVMTRIILVLMFPIALIAGTGLTLLFYEVKARRVGIAVALALVLLAAYEIRATDKPAFSIADAEQRVDVILHLAKAQRRAIARPILVVLSSTHPGDPGYMTELDAMLAAQKLNWPTVNGYSGFGVPGAVTIPSCGTGAAQVASQYAAFEAWTKARGEPQQEPVVSLLQRTLVVKGAACGGAR